MQQQKRDQVPKDALDVFPTEVWVRIAAFLHHAPDSDERKRTLASARLSSRVLRGGIRMALIDEAKASKRWRPTTQKWSRLMKDLFLHPRPEETSRKEDILEVRLEEKVREVLNAGRRGHVSMSNDTDVCQVIRWCSTTDRLHLLEPELGTRTNTLLLFRDSTFYDASFWRVDARDSERHAMLRAFKDNYRYEGVGCVYKEYARKLVCTPKDWDVLLDCVLETTNDDVDIEPYDEKTVRFDAFYMAMLSFVPEVVRHAWLSTNQHFREQWFYGDMFVTFDMSWMLKDLTLNYVRRGYDEFDGPMAVVLEAFTELLEPKLLRAWTEKRELKCFLTDCFFNGWTKTVRWGIERLGTKWALYTHTIDDTGRAFPFGRWVDLVSEGKMTREAVKYQLRNMTIWRMHKDVWGKGASMLRNIELCASYVLVFPEEDGDETIKENLEVKLRDIESDALYRVELFRRLHSMSACPGLAFWASPKGDGYPATKDLLRRVFHDLHNADNPDLEDIRRVDRETALKLVQFDSNSQDPEERVSACIVAAFHAGNEEQLCEALVGWATALHRIPKNSTFNWRYDNCSGYARDLAQFFVRFADPSFPSAFACLLSNLSYLGLHGCAIEAQKFLSPGPSHLKSPYPVLLFSRRQETKPPKDLEAEALRLLDPKHLFHGDNPWRHEFSGEFVDRLMDSFNPQVLGEVLLNQPDRWIRVAISGSLRAFKTCARALFVSFVARDRTAGLNGRRNLANIRREWRLRLEMVSHIGQRQYPSSRDLSSKARWIYKLLASDEPTLRHSLRCKGSGLCESLRFLMQNFGLETEAGKFFVQTTSFFARYAAVFLERFLRERHPSISTGDFFLAFKSGLKSLLADDEWTPMHEAWWNTIEFCPKNLTNYDIAEHFKRLGDEQIVYESSISTYIALFLEEYRRGVEEGTFRPEPLKQKRRGRDFTSSEGPETKVLCASLS